MRFYPTKKEKTKGAEVVSARTREITRIVAIAIAIASTFTFFLKLLFF